MVIYAFVVNIINQLSYSQANSNASCVHQTHNLFHLDIVVIANFANYFQDYDHQLRQNPKISSPHIPHPPHPKEKKIKNES